ncbi:RHS repeat-associated core domain-containing protein [Butyricimonas virosa]|uniref:RHS repeat-associated core domain-containing protein n=2 Tax=Butyricimonas virosa TaxID=544645 RepID=UPI0022E64BA0|nr:RHS repeat-associated core domain-containing protein [Butyricimonas virosa]
MRFTDIYDAGGNMTVDGLRGASISYNILNLPETVSIGNGKVSYIYTSSGEKLATQVGSSLTYYRGPLVYSGNNLLYLVHPEGLTRKSTIGFVYYYAKRDHLGSTRVLCHASGNTLVADQTTGYYPFGLAHGHGNLNLNRYLFSGKELQDQSLGGKLLGFYDFVSRFYDPTLGRWFNVDPKLEFVSPYGYCANNPVLYIDPNGEDIVLTISKEVTVTVATRLIDLKITVPDWTGARKIFTKSIRLQGDEILLAALDIVGIVDPTGIADALSASLYAQQGDLVNAMVSGVGLIPYLGDFAKMFRMKNHFKILSMAVESGAGAAKGGGRGLGNPFVGKSFEEIDHMFRMKGFEMKGIDPLMGKGSYFNPKTGTKYYLDWGEKEYKTGRESFHVDVFYNGHLKYEKAKFFLDGSPKQYKELKTKR